VLTLPPAVPLLPWACALGGGGGGHIVINARPELTR
jgi:hypothetical protein